MPFDLTVPLWILILPIGIATAAAWRLDDTERHRSRSHACGRCGYDRRGLVPADAVCPECGAAAPQQLASSERTGQQPLINRPARDAAAALIEQFRDGAITNHQYMDQYEFYRRDPAVGRAFWDLWFLYDDVREYRAVGDDRFSIAAAARFSRWALFLRSDLTYTWPAPPGGRVRRVILSLLLAGWVVALIVPPASIPRSVILVVPVMAVLLFAGGIMLSERLRLGRSKRREEWRVVMAHGDIATYPFRSVADLMEVGGSADLRNGLCAVCGYDLSTIPPGACPECGAGPGAPSTG